MAERYHYFWKNKSPFSQWHPSKFKGTSEYGGGEKEFECAEQWMMYNKAILFEDFETAEEILQTNEPRRMKSLGRQVKNFNSQVWDNEKFNIVKKGTELKFSQNAHLKQHLLNTKFPLVEASPSDTIWGIGLREDDPRAKRKATWRGQNLLGQILTLVRDDFIAAGDVHCD